MINGKQLRDAVISAANTLESVKQKVDELNVFPVPDGDTGSNMSMTICAAAREIAKLDDPTVTEVADKTAAALLRGARGNSGVILSVLFRGLSKGLKGKAEADGADLANALKLGVDAAYKAVMNPTEGTILTVSREGAEKGIAIANENSDALFVWSAICDACEESLARTPDLLPMLKKAGVVDAGGKGLCVIFRAMQAIFEGGEIADGTAQTATGKTKAVSAAGRFDAEITYGYCTEFIVARAKDCVLEPVRLRAYLESIGDCVVVVDDEDIIKVHVHTNDPGKALSEGIKYGQFETVKVENMRLQHSNAALGSEEESVPAAPERVEPEEPYGFVAVAAGDGLEALFTELGCTHVVAGGQTMNPSTEDILTAIEATPAKEVFVFPNNKNIIMAAEQAVPLADRKVHVLQTRTVPQGIAAMLAFDPDAATDDNLTAMMVAADNVDTGSVTFAARDSDFDGHAIKKGSILALDNGKLSFLDKEISHAASKLVRNIIAKRRLAGKEVNFINLIFGDKVSEDEAEALRASFEGKVGDAEITVINGGQPVYYYFISVE